MRRSALLLGLALLGACQDEPPPPVVYVPPSYDYLNKLRLNVTSVDVENRFVPGADPRHIEALAPTQPAAALRQMAQDRLIAGGGSGRAVFVIDDASVVRGPGRLEGSLAAHLDVSTTGGTKSGYAEAKVARTRTLSESDDPAAVRAGLDALVTAMMADMNVELEYQVRRSLKEYLQTPLGAAGASGPVTREALPPPVKLTP